MRYYRLLAAAAIFAAAPVAHAAIKPASVFTDNAVLQQQMPIPVWGTADPGETVKVSIDGATATAVAAADGKWSVKLAALKAGGPFTMSITGSAADAVTLSNILVGEVWVCSGQSNMEFGIKLAAEGEKAIAASDNPQIRLFNAGNALAFTPQPNCPGAWAQCTPDFLRKGGVWGGFSAVAYYFGRDLQKSLNVPIGLIQAARGGTMAALWTSREGLSSNAALKYYVDQYDADMGYYGEALKPSTATSADLKALYTEAKAKYDADNAPAIAKYAADVDTAKANYAADVDAAKAAGQPVPAGPVLPRRPRLPLAPHDFSAQADPTQLFNGIVHPLIPYAIRGVIWYQGESNSGGDGSYPARSFEYQTLFPTLIADWRSHWGEGDFPFYFVQLAGYVPPAPRPTPFGWAETREAQRLTALTTPNTGMAVITDLGDSKNIHPKRKEAVGDRLALIARAVTYKQPVEYSGPQFASLKIAGNKARVTFTHAAGLAPGPVIDGTGTAVAFPDKLVGFEVAGADQKYFAAAAAIDGAEIVLSSPNVPNPVAVRYGWANFPVANLQNASGLWASPFKTDDWPWASRNNHG